MNDIKQVEMKLNRLLNKKEKVILLEVERLARNVLIKNSKKIQEFVMCMGTYFFVDIYGEVLYEWQAEKLRCYKTLDNFICKFNEQFKITGNPMRFTATGNITTNW